MLLGMSNNSISEFVFWTFAIILKGFYDDKDMPKKYLRAKELISCPDAEGVAKFERERFLQMVPSLVTIRIVNKPSLAK